MKVCVVFGGMSTEHDISIVSGTSVIKNIDKQKYDIIPVYIDKNGVWNKYMKPLNEIEILKVGEEITEVEKIENVVEFLKQMDVVFPVMHGLYGEDGAMQGLLEMLKIPYVGCKILASCICMDKAYTKIILEKAGINQAKHVYVKSDNEKYIFVDDNFNESEMSANQISKTIIEKLGLPVFVKPSNSGSSVGVNKAGTQEEVIEAIDFASKFDKKIIIEEAINGREVECAVLGNQDALASDVGEIITTDEFYDFDSKYKNPTSRVVIPAELSEQVRNEVRNLAIKAYHAVDASGLARVDFFVEKNTNRIILNEINTMPGFTTISMYPKLWEQQGLKYTDLLDKLIKLAIE